MERVWKNPWLRFFAGIAAIILLLWAAYALRSILIPLIFAFIAAYVFDPIVVYLQGRGIPRTITIALLLALIFAFIAGILLVIIPDFVQQTVQLADVVQENLPKVRRSFQDLFERYSGYPLAETFDRYLNSSLALLQKNMPQILQSLEKAFTGIISYTFSVLGVIVNFVLFSVVSVYLLKDFHLLTEKAEELIPLKHRPTVLDVLGKINGKLRGFFRGQLVVGTILSVFYFVGLLLIGVPYALLLALIGGYGQIIPYMGLILALFPAMLLALIKYGDFIHPLLAGLLYAVGQALEGSIITPRVMSGKVGLHPVVIILSVLVFGKIMGFIGILVAVPLATVLLVLLQELLARYKKSSLYTSASIDYSQPDEETKQKVSTKSIPY